MTARAGQAQTRKDLPAREFLNSCAREHGCCHPIDYRSPASGKIHPQASAAGHGLTGLFLTKTVSSRSHFWFWLTGEGRDRQPLGQQPQGRNRKRDVKGGSGGNAKWPQPDLLHCIENAPSSYKSPYPWWSPCHSREDSPNPLRLCSVTRKLWGFCPGWAVLCPAAGGSHVHQQQVKSSTSTLTPQNSPKNPILVPHPTEHLGKATSTSAEPSYPHLHSHPPNSQGFNPHRNFVFPFLSAPSPRLPCKSGSASKIPPGMLQPHSCRTPLPHFNPL